MKNKAWIVLVVVFLVLLALVVLFFNKKNSGATETSTGQTATKQSPLSFNSMQDLLSKSLSIECLFTNEQGLSTHTYVKNGAVRTQYEGKTTTNYGNTIIKDNKMYSWSDKTKEGVVISFDLSKITPPAQNPTGKTPSDSTSQSSPYQALQEIEKFKKACKPAVVSDSLFTPPKEVKFIDFLQQMNDLKSKTTAPSNNSQPSAIDEEQIKKMMQQYQSQPSPSEENQ